MLNKLCVNALGSVNKELELEFELQIVAIIAVCAHVIISKKRKKKHFNAKIIFTYSGKTTTGSHFVRRGDYQLIIQDSEPMTACDFVRSPVYLY